MAKVYKVSSPPTPQVGSQETAQGDEGEVRGILRQMSMTNRLTRCVSRLAFVRFDGGGSGKRADGFRTGVSTVQPIHRSADSRSLCGAFDRGTCRAHLWRRASHCRPVTHPLCRVYTLPDHLSQRWADDLRLYGYARRRSAQWQRVSCDRRTDDGKEKRK